MGVPRPMGTRWSVKHGVAAPTPICGGDSRVRGAGLRSVIKIDPRPGRLGVVFLSVPRPKGRRRSGNNGAIDPTPFVGEIPECEECACEV